jgi:signal peptidase II
MGINIPPVSSDKWRQSLLLFSMALAVTVTDQVTKLLVRANMDLGQSIPDEGRFRLTYSTNSGSIFGLPLDATFLMFMAPVVIAVILWLYFYYLPAASRLMRGGLGLLLGGAVGNWIDRVWLREVTDFIDVQLSGSFHWATFNVADASITVGIVVLIYCFLIMARES